jgi:hypothetical protein
MRSATYDLTITSARAEALFASPLQRSDEPSSAAVAAFGIRGCAARVAQAYGEYPETAVLRMRWACAAVADTSGSACAEPACLPGARHAHLPSAA